MGSRSMRGGTSWLVFAALCTDEDEIETLMDLLESTGVERLMDGRLSAAGLMSTIVEEQSPPRVAEGRRERMRVRMRMRTRTRMREKRASSGRALLCKRARARRKGERRRQDSRAQNAAQSWGGRAFICASEQSGGLCDHHSGFKSMDRA